MKKIVSIMLIVSTVFIALTGCGKKKETVIITGVDDLAGKKIGVQEGTTGDIYATDIENAKISRFKKGVDAAIDLKNGKIDAVILDEQPAKKIVANNKDLVILTEEFSLEDYAIAVAKGNEELLNSINATIAKLKSNGKYQEFLEAYIPENGEVVIPKHDPTNFSQDIIMGTNAEFEPFEYRQGETIVGLDIELAHEIANDFEKNLKIEDMNFDSLIGALSSGKIDMIIAGMTVTDERKESVDFSDSYYTSKQVIIVRQSSNVVQD